MNKTCAATLVDIQPCRDVELTRFVEKGAPEWSSDSLATYDGVFLSGSRGSAEAFVD